MADKLSPQQAGELFSRGALEESTYRAALGLDLDPELIAAIAGVESANDPKAVSPKGARGLMQVMPGTAAEVAGKIGLRDYDLDNPTHSKLLGEYYFNQQLKDFESNPRLALAAYNAGPGRLRQASESAGGDRSNFEKIAEFLPEETRNYVPKVMDRYAAGPAQAPGLPPAAQPPEPSQVTFPGQVNGTDRTQPAQMPAPAVVQSTPQPAAAAPLAAPAPQPAAAQPQIQNQAAKQALQPQAPSAMQQSNDAYSLKAEAIQEGTAAGLKKAAEVKALRDQEIQRQQAELKAEQERLAEEQRIDAETRQELQQAKQDVLGAGIDTGRFWKNKSTGEKILAGISIFLGGFAASQRGGRNSALMIIENAIDRDIDAQRADLLKKTKVYDIQQGIYSDMRRRFGSDRQARAAVRALAFEKAKQQIEVVTKGTTAPEVIAASKKLYADVELARQKAEKDLIKAALEDPQTRAGQRKNVVEQLENPEAINVDASQLSDKDKKLFIPGFGFALTPEAATDFRASLSSTRTSASGLSRLKEIITKNEGQILGVIPDLTARSLKGEIATIRQTLVGALRLPITGPGAMNEGERQMLEDMIADPLEMLSTDAGNLQRIETLESRISESLKNKATAAGLPATGSDDLYSLAKKGAK